MIQWRKKAATAAKKPTISARMIINTLSLICSTRHSCSRFSHSGLLSVTVVSIFLFLARITRLSFRDTLLLCAANRVFLLKSRVNPCLNLLSNNLYFAVFFQFDDARWRMGFMLLTTTPAYIVHCLQNTRINVAIVLGSRFSTDIR